MEAEGIHRDKGHDVIFNNITTLRELSEYVIADVTLTHQDPSWLSCDSESTTTMMKQHAWLTSSSTK